MRAFDALGERLEAVRPDRAAVLSSFTEALAPLVPFDTCAVTLASADGKYETAHAAGANAELLRGRRLADNDGVTGWVIANQQPFCNADPQLDFPPELAPSFSSYRTLAAFPVARGAEAHGALTLYSVALAEYDAGHQRLLTAAVAVLATALSHANRAAEIKHDHAGPRDGEAPRAALDRDAIKLHAPIESELTH